MMIKVSQLFRHWPQIRVCEYEFTSTSTHSTRGEIIFFFSWPTIWRLQLFISLSIEFTHRWEWMNLHTWGRNNASRTLITLPRVTVSTSTTAFTNTHFHTPIAPFVSPCHPPSLPFPSRGSLQVEVQRARMVNTFYTIQKQSQTDKHPLFCFPLDHPFLCILSSFFFFVSLPLSLSLPLLALHLFHFNKSMKPTSNSSNKSNGNKNTCKSKCNSCQVHHLIKR